MLCSLLLARALIALFAPLLGASRLRCSLTTAPPAQARRSPCCVHCSSRERSSLCSLRSLALRACDARSLQHLRRKRDDLCDARSLEHLRRKRDDLHAVFIAPRASAHRSVRSAPWRFAPAMLAHYSTSGASETISMLCSLLLARALIALFAPLLGASRLRCSLTTAPPAQAR